jgi:hypothetical protein
VQSKLLDMAKNKAAAAGGSPEPSV